MKNPEENFKSIRKDENLIGIDFCRLTVIGYMGSNKKKKNIWLCECSCEPRTKRVVTSACLKHGHVRSCGCLRKELHRSKNQTHGLSRTKEHRIWLGIKTRCYNEKVKAYKNYGGRGIKMCDRWLESFENFLEDMKNCPNDKDSIDRENVNGNYQPENCRWATKKEQVNNARSNVKLTLDNKTQNVSQWAEELGISAITLYNRVRKGWSDERVLTQPIGKQGRKKNEN